MLAKQYFNPRGVIEKTRHHLPHWRQEAVPIFATWRLGDAIPGHLQRSWKAERDAWLELHPRPWTGATRAAYSERFSERFDRWLDAGWGACHLRDPRASLVMAESLHHFDGERYALLAYAIMPNHVHVLFKPGPDYLLPEILKSWKGYSAREVNRILRRRGKLWQDDTFDRLVRDPIHLYHVCEYIRSNPEKAGLGAGEARVWEAEDAGDEF